MSRPPALAAAAGRFVDLAATPFTLPGSRLLVRRDAAAGLCVLRAGYEVAPADSVLLSGLRVLAPTGQELPVTHLAVDRIEFGGGAASLTFAGVDALSVGGGEVSVTARLADGAPVSATASEAEGVLIAAPDPAEGSVAVTRGGHHARALAATRRRWLDWFARCPRVGAELQPIVAHCWWVLGANTVELKSVPGSRAVVPAKLGYLGLWQWDAYFIAIGLRHGDLDLAAEQLELALRFARDDGQLPDVVHDTGVLAGSEDLPPGDLARLRELGSPAARPGVRVPLTKPPLAALALARLAESGLPSDRLEALVPVIEASQHWWLTACLAPDGLPEYTHPYSSGLDDSPVFDADLPVATPDLAAYLELQDRQLEELYRRLGRDAEAGRSHRRAGESRQRLLRLWHADASRFRCRGRNGPIAAHTVLDLLPLITGTLPGEIASALVADLDDPETFASRFPVPSVAAADPSFDPERMWRGPVWLNMNWLLVEGLQRHGRAERARALARDTLRMVATAGGAFEYYGPESGRRAGSAVSCFGWTAALIIDLAVRFGSAAEA